MTVDQIINRLLPLLPNEGKKSKRAFALFSAERVAHLNPDPRVAACLAVVRQKVVEPESVTKAELTHAARSAAFAREAAYAAAYDDADDDAYAAFCAAAAAVSAANIADYAADAAAHAAEAAYDAAHAAAYAPAHATIFADDDAREAERKAQLDYLLSLAMTQFYPDYWVNTEMFEETGEIFTMAHHFVSIRKITDENALVALDYFLEKRKVLPNGLGCWCRR